MWSMLGKWRLARRAKGAARGAIDRFDGRRLDGWAIDSSSPEVPLAVALLVDGVRVAEGVADGARPDLSANGLGAGLGGLSISLDQPIVSRDSVRLELVTATTEHSVRGAARDFALGDPVTLTIDTLGLAGIAGRVTGGQAALAGDETVVIEVDGAFAASGPLVRGPDGLGFSIYLPTRLYDGRPHLFEACVAGPASDCRAVADILPAIQTPPAELCDSASSRGYAGLSALASLRYEALRERLSDAAGRPDAAAFAANVSCAHDLLVRGHGAPDGPLNLALPSVGAPRVSVVVPVHGGAALTRHCLASLVLAAGRVPFEVVLVDDASPDATPEFLADVANLVTVRNDTNVGFLHSCLRGATRARGEYLVFLNNDTEVTAGWLEELVDAFEREPGVGAVGAKLVYPDGRLQDAGGLVWDSGVPWNVGHGDNPWAPEYNYLRDVDYLTGAALMVSRAAWDAVGGFDADYAPAYYEDTDLAFALRAAGYRTLYCPHACVVHYEGGSHGTDVEHGVKRHQIINAERFVAKWHHEFAGLGEEGVRPELEKDRGRAFRVLVIDHEFPCVGQDAGSYAAVQEMRLLIALGAKVTFVPHNFRHVGHHVEALQKLGIECVHAPFHTSVEVFLQRRGSEFDLVYITRFDVAERVLPHVRALTSAPVVFNNADLHFLREMRQAIARGERDFRTDAGATRDRELAVLDSVDAILSYNETEHEIIASHLMRNDSLFRCPWVLEPVARVAPFEARRGLAFLGGFGHPPNAEGLRWFAARVLPLIVAERPDIRLHVWGSRMPDGLAAELGEHVVVEGFAESLHQVFDTCRVFVAPLLSGAGIKGKVLDSVAHGVPAVLSPVACEATGLVHGTDTFVAANPEDWARHVIRLHDDEALWQGFSGALHTLAEHRYSFEGGMQAMRAVLDHVGVRHGVAPGTRAAGESDATASRDDEPDAGLRRAA